MKRLSITILIITLICCEFLTIAQQIENRAPIVSNIRVRQLDFNTVEILYDLNDPDGEKMTVSIRGSSDGGDTFDLPMTDISGEIGENIKNGNETNYFFSFSNYIF